MTIAKRKVSDREENFDSIDPMINHFWIVTTNIDKRQMQNAIKMCRLYGFTTVTISIRFRKFH